MLEGTVVNVTDKSGAGSHKRGNPGGSLSSPSKGETYSVDTSNILFILSGAFIGLEKIIGDRLSKGVILILLRGKLFLKSNFFFVCVVNWF